MSERQLELDRVSKLLKQNKQDLDDTKLNADQCEASITNYNKRLKYLANEYKYKEDLIQKQLTRAIKNAKNSHKKLDELISTKKDLHVKFKKANHYGEIQCEFCKKYFTQAGLSRHKNNCSSMPSKKKVDKVKAEITIEEDAIEARKAALEKELAELKKAKPKAKPKPVKVVKAKPELEPEIEWPGDNGTTATNTAPEEPKETKE